MIIKTIHPFMKLHSGNKFKVIGVMSGTSCDGLDLAACEFIFRNGKWIYSIFAAETIEYGDEWTKKLKNASALSGVKLIELHAKYGKFLGLQVNSFLKKTGFQPDLISSHGHTIFHQPDKHFTFQLGNGAYIASTSGITTISDFRIADVALGGQGAPLVPIGDQLLFSEFDACLNLGGFANISFFSKGKRIAYDVCPVNIVLNHLANMLGLKFDKDGELGKKGNVNDILLQKLNNIDYYQQNPPKSLGREWLENVFLPVLNSVEIPVNEVLGTVYEHIAIQVSDSILLNGKVLVTGGGAFNTFLIDRIRKKSSSEIILPNEIIINFKEALIFAFLGVLKITDQINCFSSATGAKKDSSCGTIFNF